MNTILNEQLNEIKRLCNTYNVQSLYSFGSVNKSSFNKNSDIDLLIAFKKNISIEDYTENYFALHQKFSELFKRKVDLVTENSLTNPYFIKSVDQNKQLLYES